MKLRVEPGLCGVRDNGPLDSGTSVISSDHIAAARARGMADSEACELLCFGAAGVWRPFERRTLGGRLGAMRHEAVDDAKGGQRITADAPIAGDNEARRQGRFGLPGPNVLATRARMRNRGRPSGP